MGAFDGGMAGQAPSPSAFMSPPGMNPQQFAALMAMQNQGTPQSAATAGPVGQGVPTPGAQGVSPLLARLAQLNPAVLRALLLKFGIGAGAGGAPGAGAAPQIPAPAAPGAGGQ